MILIADIETDDLDASRIWCVVLKEYKGDKHEVYTHIDRVPSQREALQKRLNEASKVVFHNGIGFDWKVLVGLGKIDLPKEKVVDTLIMSRLLWYDRPGGHSLRNWGIKLGLHKGDFKDFASGLSDEMVEYCKNDVDVTEKVLTTLNRDASKWPKDTDWPSAVRLEHDMQFILEEATDNGFDFNKTEAEKSLAAIMETMAKLEAGFSEGFPPLRKELKRIKYRLTNDGKPFKNVVETMEEFPDYEIENDELVVYHMVPFSPASPKQRVERLWDAGWKPFERTKGHLTALREAQNFQRKRKPVPKELKERLDKFSFYGYTCSEDNLKTLPPTAPKAAQNLAMWLTLDGRRSSLVEWLGQVKEDGRIHGRFSGLGAWTHRLAHNSPNQANIPSVFHGEPKTAVEEIKSKYDGLLRSYWCVPEDHYQIGVDAEGIQLRILAHLMRSEEYREAILSGDKSLETDIHNINKRALNLDHITRDNAKTFIYAFLLGAGIPKVANILNCSTSEAKASVENFTHSIEGLHKLKHRKLPIVAKRGYFIGLDGRRVVFPSAHKLLAGLLQNGEAVIMKTATRRWYERLQEEGLEAQLMTLPHDEWQTRTRKGASFEEAQRIGELQVEAIKWTGNHLGLFCPLDGEINIGHNWRDCH